MSLFTPLTQAEFEAKCAAKRAKGVSARQKNNAQVTAVTQQVRMQVVQPALGYITARDKSVPTTI
jgi:hypothetical protein